MIVRWAFMDDGSVFEVIEPVTVALKCNGYVFGYDQEGNECVLNVAYIKHFGPRMESKWIKEGGQ